MIRINLLPEEYRRKARTPIKLLVAFVGAAAVNAGLMSWWAWTVFGVQAGIDSEKATLELEMEGLAPQVAYHQALDAESKQYQSREKTLAGITASRISWTRKIDELIDVVNRGGDGQRHLVWLDDLQVSQTSDSNAQSYGSVRANGHSGSDKFAQVANFLEDLESSTFIEDFQPPSPPEGTQTLVDETLVPPVAWAFPMSLSLKSPEDRAKSAAAAAAKQSADEGGKTERPKRGKNAAKTPTVEPAKTPAGEPAKTPGEPAKTPGESAKTPGEANTPKPAPRTEAPAPTKESGEAAPPPSPKGASDKKEEKP